MTGWTAEGEGQEERRRPHNSGQRHQYRAMNPAQVQYIARTCRSRCSRQRSDVLVEEEPCAMRNANRLLACSSRSCRRRKCCAYANSDSALEVRRELHHEHEADNRLWLEADSCKPTGASTTREMSGPRFNESITRSKECYPHLPGQLRIEPAD